MAVAVLLVAIVGVLVWLVRFPPEHEPVYQGRTLTQWLDKYNRAGALAKTEPVSQAIRAMGTNILPFLLAHIKHINAPLMGTPVALLLRFIKVPFYYGEDACQSPSMLALHALGSQAQPLLPELLSAFQDPRTRDMGMTSLVAIGPDSIPTLERACQSSSLEMRTDAVWLICMLKTVPPRGLYCYWDKAINGKSWSRFRCWANGRSGPDLEEQLVKLLEHSDPAVRRASAERIASYPGGLHDDAKRSALPLLTKALKDEDQAMSRAATNAFRHIDREAATNAGVNWWW
jgi:hypothetical protein